MNTKVYFTAFPEIEIPQLLLDLGFDDNSWRNDAYPRAEFELDQNTVLVVWCLPEEIEKREREEDYLFIAQIENMDRENLQDEVVCKTLQDLEKVVRGILSDFCVDVCEWCKVAGDTCEETRVGKMCSRCCEAVASRGGKL
jgi:hypothetical protein